MARNSADVVDHEVDAMLSADDHESDDAAALAAIHASWFDDSERTGVLEPRHLLAQPSHPVPEAPQRESESRPIVVSAELPPLAAEDPRWVDEHEESLEASLARIAQWEEPDLTGSAEWEDAQTAYFERTANFELLDSRFVSEYTDRLPGGLSELVSSDGEPPASQRSNATRQTGVRESARVVARASVLDEAHDLSDVEDREQSEHFAYSVSPSARAASEYAARPVPTPATKQARLPRSARRSGSKLETPSQLAASLQRKAAAMEASHRPAPRTSPLRPSASAPAQWVAAPNTPVPSRDTASLRPSPSRMTRPSVPAQPSALPLTAGFDSDMSELREHRRNQAAAWLWVTASALAGVALILVVRAWTNGSLPTLEALQQPSVAVETTLNAAQSAETGFAITSHPEGAQIYVDGRPTGFITPARVRRLTPGLHSVELKLAGYYDTSLPAALQENTILELAPLEMRPHPASVSEPAAAAPPVGGIVPQLAAAPVRSHVQRAKGRRWRHRGISRNAPMRRLDDGASDRASAASGEGTLRINSRPWARVMVDNKFVGNTPQRGLRVASGEHTIRLVNEPLNMSKTFHVRVRDGETVTRVELLNEDAEQSHVSKTSARDVYARADR